MLAIYNRLIGSHRHRKHPIRGSESHRRRRIKIGKNSFALRFVAGLFVKRQSLVPDGYTCKGAFALLRS